MVADVSKLEHNKNVTTSIIILLDEFLRFVIQILPLSIKDHCPIGRQLLEQELSHFGYQFQNERLLSIRSAPGLLGTTHRQLDKPSFEFDQWWNLIDDPVIQIVTQLLKKTREMGQHTHKEVKKFFGC